MSKAANDKGDHVPDPSRLKLVQCRYNGAYKNYLFLAPKATKAGDFLVVPNRSACLDPAIVRVAVAKDVESVYVGPVVHALSRIPSAQLARFTTQLDQRPELGETKREF